MNIFIIASQSIRKRSTSAVLSIILTAFGVAIITIMLQGFSQLQQLVSSQSRGIDMVVGAKGSPLQLILCNVFHIDFPTGNISLKESYALSKNRLIEKAIPISLGDSYQGYRIVGSTDDFLKHYLTSDSIEGLKLDANSILAGSKVAQNLSLKVGQKIASAHGLSAGGGSHDHELIIRKILPSTGSVLDELLVTDLNAIWEMHYASHETDSTSKTQSVFGIMVSNETYEKEKITALLVKYRSPMAAIQLPRLVNESTSMQAASPAFEVARLMTILEPSKKIVSALGAFILILSLISLWVSLIHSLKERKYELAIMRTMGARKSQLAMMIISEAVFLAIAGCLLGLFSTHMLFAILSFTLDQSSISGAYIMTEEWILIGASVLIGTAAAAWPAISVYRSSISDTLSKG